MCIGWPMQVVASRPGFATVRRRRAAANGAAGGATHGAANDPGGVPEEPEEREVRTALVGAVAPGDWLLVFLDDARERLDAARAAEIDATLALVEAALRGEGVDGVDGASPVSPAALALPATLAPFDLPSALTAEQLQAFR